LVRGGKDPSGSTGAWNEGVGKVLDLGHIATVEREVGRERDEGRLEFWGG